MRFTDKELYRFLNQLGARDIKVTYDPHYVDATTFGSLTPTYLVGRKGFDIEVDGREYFAGEGQEDEILARIVEDLLNV